MRKKSREMDAAFAYVVAARAPYMTLAVTNSDGTPYCVPVSPAMYNGFLYFHCAVEGQKLDCIRYNPKVCLSAVSRCAPKSDEFTLEYESAIIKGRAYEVTDQTEKIESLRAICERYTPKHMDNFDAAIARSLNITEIIRIEIDEITGKRKKYDSAGVEMKWGRME